MSQGQDDALMALLSDIAGGIAMLAERVETIDARIAAQDDWVNEALVTIAEITARTYYGTKPAKTLPDEVINARVISPMIDRWPRDAPVGIAKADYDVLSDLSKISSDNLETLDVRVRTKIERSNVGRLRQRCAVDLITQEVAKRVEALAEQKRLAKDRERTR